MTSHSPDQRPSCEELLNSELFSPIAFDGTRSGDASSQAVSLITPAIQDLQALDKDQLIQLIMAQHQQLVDLTREAPKKSV